MMNITKNICVYSSSSNSIDDIYYRAAEDLGRCIVENNYRLVYGGGNIGLMSILAQSVHKNGGYVTGVIPEALKAKELAYNNADKLITTKTMGERKETMEMSSAAFIALPGGLGTLEEVLEILTLKQLNYHSKPVVFINTADFFRRLFDLFEFLYLKGFTKTEYKELYYIASDAQGAISYINSHYNA
ncbi:MAG: TIGR00730 family Rossman fold protein [Elusimicrobiota bacterium]